MLRKLAAFGTDKSGSTAIEYALIGGLISVAIIPAASAIGPQLSEMFSGILAAFG